LHDLVSLARSGRLDLIYIALPMKAEARIKNLVEELADTTITLYFVPDFFIFNLLQARWTSLVGLPAISVYDSPFYGVSGWLKRVEDLLLVALLSPFLTVAMLFIAAAVKLTSEGPAFFRQARYGLDGKKILVWKFRTMSVCEDGPAIAQATQNDARTTKLGSLLRRTSLDELPQFFNVLSGNMSVVGPRPHAVIHNEHYRKLISGYMLRHKVKPGITGWAQVNGFRGRTDTLDKMEGRDAHDLWYIHNWTLTLDVKIVWRTVVGGMVGANAF